jgi:hypothetical protein
MVNMTMENAGWPKMGRMTARSSTTPQYGKPVGKTQHGHAHQAAKGTEHHQFALRKADRLGRLVDQYEAQRNQPIDAPLCNPANHQLKKQHVVSRRYFLLFRYSLCAGNYR